MDPDTLPGWAPLRALALCLLLVSGAARADLSGSITPELRYFPEPALDDRQARADLSLALRADYYRDWGDQRLVIAPFLRLDAQDDERTHADLREAYWRMRWTDAELRVGLRRVYWGVAESQQLVNVINQTDLVEDIDGKTKLGQPMINLAWLPRAGTVDFFLLPYFRERTFPGADGRPRGDPWVDTDHPVYQSDREARHLDWAIRFQGSLGPVDLGLAHFQGTARDPRLVPGLTASFEPVLIPHYDQIRQTGLDLQLTQGGWLWKLELISRRQQGERHAAATAGFEYTLGQVAGSDADLGLLMEALWDERGDRATTPFERDLFLGVRLALNDEAGTDLLAGVIVDPEDDARAWSLEASRRLGQQWKASVKARAFQNVPVGNPLYGFRQDDYVQLGVGYYF